MGTGVGEAMLIGAAVGATAGGAGAAIQGGDPLKGALLGGATGAIGGGLSGAFPGAAAIPGGGAAPAASGSFGSLSGAGTGAVGGAGLGGTAAIPSTFGSFAAPGATSSIPGVLGSSAAGSAGISASSGALGGSSGIVGALPAGSLGTYTPGMYAEMYGPGSSAVSALSPTTQALASGAQPPLTDISKYLPTPDLTQNREAQRQVADVAGKNIFGYMPGEKGFISNPRLATIGGTSLLGGLMQAERDQFGIPGQEDYESTFDPSKFQRSTPTYAPESVYRPQYRDYTTAAEGGIMKLANGGPVERMSMMNTAMNPQGGLYPQGMIDKTQYATPTQRPVSSELMETEPAYQRSNPMLMAEGGIAEILQSAKAQGLSPEMYQSIYGRGNAIIEMEKALKEGKMVNMARGGISDLGGYSDGGRMLKGPGDGMSDSIPANIGGRQPARLADSEFVVPADVVSHLGNGSTDAGAKRLYAMMDKVRKARTGKKKQAPAIKAEKYIPTI